MTIFAGVKILDLTRVFSGPFATRHFAELGAEVIKVEPLHGDDSRNFPPKIGDWSGYFEILNHNKQSMVLDLRKDEDLHQLYDLCASCDVLVENFSANVTRKLRIDYETVRALHPQLIYASICGVHTSVERKYYDLIAQAESGIMSLNGTDTDMKNATSIVDAFTGMKMAYAISTALFNRLNTQVGCHVIVSMKGAAFDLLEQNLITSSVTAKNPEKTGNMDNAIAPFGVFKTKDANIVLAIGNNTLWHIFEEFIQAHAVSFPSHLFTSNIQRLQHLEELTVCIEGVFTQYIATQIVEKLSQLGIPCAKVNTMLDVLADKENYEQNLLQVIQHSQVGNIVVPTGGIFFSNAEPVSYKESPQLPKQQ
jgi:CoA:oxalate CoA-transferase